VTSRGPHPTGYVAPAQRLDTTPDAGGDDVEALDFEVLLEASTLADPTVEQIRRLVPSEVSMRVQERLAEWPAHPVPEADTAVLQVVRMCQTEQGAGSCAEVLRLLLDRGALADVHAEVTEEILAAAFTGASKPPAVVVETCLAVLDKGRLGEELASRFALLLAPGDRPQAPPAESAPEPGQDAPGQQVAEAPARPGRAWARWREQPRLRPGGHVDFSGVFGPGALAVWFRLLRLTLITVPLVLLAALGFLVSWVVGLQPRPERWLGALACTAGTVVAGGFGLRWSRRRLSRWRAHASPR